MRHRNRGRPESRRGISIHAPREGCDLDIGLLQVVDFSDFNPRTPRGVRRLAFFRGRVWYVISIHAPREGCDSSVVWQPLHLPYFNPRTPRGVRPSCPSLDADDSEHFNPRTPRGVRRGGATAMPGLQGYFNPRTPRGVRPACPPVRPCHRDFNPRTPRGVRPRLAHLVKTASPFQSTHPARGATWARLFQSRGHHNFNPRTPRGVRRLSPAYPDWRRNFNPRTPRGVRLYQQSEVPNDQRFQSTHPARGATLVSRIYM